MYRPRVLPRHVDSVGPQVPPARPHPRQPLWLRRKHGFRCASHFATAPERIGPAALCSGHTVEVGLRRRGGHGIPTSPHEPLESPYPPAAAPATLSDRRRRHRVHSTTRHSRSPPATAPTPACPRPQVTGDNDIIATARLRWPDATDATGYIIERRTSDTAPWQQIGLAPFSSTPEPYQTFTDSDLDVGRTYSYRVTAFNGSGQSTSSVVQVVPKASGYGVLSHYWNSGFWGNDERPGDWAGGWYLSTLPDQTVASGHPVDYYWADGAPTAPFAGGGAAGDLRLDSFSTAFSGKIHADDTGDYYFTTLTDDDGLLYVNNQLVSADPFSHGFEYSRQTAPVYLEAGNDYEFLFIEAEQFGAAGAKMQWMSPAMQEQGRGFEPVPVDSLSATLRQRPARPFLPPGRRAPRPAPERRADGQRRRALRHPRGRRPGPRRVRVHRPRRRPPHATRGTSTATASSATPPATAQAHLGAAAGRWASTTAINDHRFGAGVRRDRRPGGGFHDATPRQRPADGTFTGPATVAEGAAATFAFTNVSDPSEADRNAGYTYTYFVDANRDGRFTEDELVAGATGPSFTTTFNDNGVFNVRG